MTTIIVTHADQRVEQFHFGGEAREISIGRRSVNDVCVPDLSVSGSHARIVFEPKGAFIEDLKSTNGTYINGRLINRQALADQDEVVLGKVRLAYLSDVSNVNVAQRADDADDEDGDLVLDRSSTSGTYEPFTGAADESLSLSDRARVALGRDPAGYPLQAIDASDAVALAGHEIRQPAPGHGAPRRSETGSIHGASAGGADHEHPLDGLQARSVSEFPVPDGAPGDQMAHRGAVIEIRNGAKSGQVLPIDKPVTTLGRPGIQIAAIMRKPDGFFLMHIESDDQVSRPTLNESAIGDEPVLLEHGDQLNVAGIDVQFLRS